ncbi:hypothetical protein D3C80_1117530 [compost metagenome]
MDRQLQKRLRLLLPHQDGAPLDVLSPHLAHVAGALRGVEQQIERQALSGSYRPVRLELGDVRLCPHREALRSDLQRFDADCRIVRSPLTRHGKRQHPPQHLHQIVRRRRRLRFAVAHFQNVLGLERPH